MRKLPILALLAAGLLPGAVRAELPPTAYEAMREKATVVMLLQVQAVALAAVQGDGRMRETPVMVRARVLSVIRGTGFKIGDTVTIRYSNVRPMQRGWVGPAPIPILTQGTRVLAWLNKGKQDFVPAARGRSFEKMR